MVLWDLIEIVDSTLPLFVQRGDGFHDFYKNGQLIYTNFCLHIVFCVLCHAL